MAKVKFGFKNAYYAKITESGYDTPKKLNGAVSMSLSPSGDTVEFYADDMSYFGENTNNGYEGTLELALIPDEFKQDILGEVLDDNGVMVEDATAIQSNFALLCEFTNDTGNTKFAFLNCFASRPDLAGTTKSTTKEVQTETLNITIRPNADGKVKYTSTETTDESVLSSWYTEVYDGTNSL